MYKGYNIVTHCWQGIGSVGSPLTNTPYSYEIFKGTEFITKSPSRFFATKQSAIEYAKNLIDRKCLRNKI